jgi:HPt (histidine-containing phosphotransfer) domain-containing protein
LPYQTIYLILFWFGRLNQQDNDEREPLSILAFASDAIAAGVIREANVLTAQQINSKFESLKSRGFNPVTLWERVGGDIELLGDLVEIFAEECTGMMAHIERAIAMGNAVELQKASHKFKGSVLQFSASDAAALAADLEEMGRTNSMGNASHAFARLKEQVVFLNAALGLMMNQAKPE